jgi:hypothetical protein
MNYKIIVRVLLNQPSIIHKEETKNDETYRNVSSIEDSIINLDQDIEHKIILTM